MDASWGATESPFEPPVRPAAQTDSDMFVVAAADIQASAPPQEEVPTEDIDTALDELWDQMDFGDGPSAPVEADKAASAQSAAMAEEDLSIDVEFSLDESAAEAEASVDQAAASASEDAVIEDFSIDDLAVDVALDSALGEEPGEDPPALDGALPDGIDIVDFDLGAEPQPQGEPEDSATDPAAKTDLGPPTPAELDELSRLNASDLALDLCELAEELEAAGDVRGAVRIWRAAQLLEPTLLQAAEALVRLTL